MNPRTHETIYFTKTLKSAPRRGKGKENKSQIIKNYQNPPDTNFNCTRIVLAAVTVAAAKKGMKKGMEKEDKNWKNRKDREIEQTSCGTHAEKCHVTASASNFHAQNVQQRKQEVAVQLKPC
ncbi:hypothetical protein V1477_014888 [Vespula maculifrons]|uniref:Uncharacterized protein n=1 Tax=Vespula maculifrons TaxID=7453 RepID=A0ABD2BIR7_VESMC